LTDDDVGSPVINNSGGGGTNTSPSANYFLDLGFNATDSVATKLAYVRSQLVTAFTPQGESPVIDKGVIIVGYHCPTADDDPVTPADPEDSRRHWFGAAPDIGAFEYDPNAPKAPENIRIVQ